MPINVDCKIALGYDAYGIYNNFKSSISLFKDRL